MDGWMDGWMNGFRLEQSSQVEEKEARIESIQDTKYCITYHKISFEPPS